MVLVAGCAVHEAPFPPGHPANPHAAVGRTAGAPPSLRPGIVTYGDARTPADAASPDAAPDPHAGHHGQPADAPMQHSPPSAPNASDASTPHATHDSSAKPGASQTTTPNPPARPEHR
jgi:hypothetical protein